MDGGVILNFDDLEAGDAGGAEDFGDIVDDAGDAGAEAATFEIADGFTGDGLGEDGEGRAAGVAHAIVEADEGATGADAADDSGDVAAGNLVNDFAGGSHAVGEGVVEVFKLAGEEDVGGLAEAFDFGEGAADAVGFGGEDDVAAVAADHHGSFGADAFGHDGGEAEAELSADEGHGDGGGAAGGFDDEGARLDAFFAERFFENKPGNAVFGGAAGVQEFELAPDEGAVVDGDAFKRSGLDSTEIHLPMILSRADGIRREDRFRDFGDGEGGR